MAKHRRPLAELVAIRPRFTRSVHLERDFHAKDSADGYIVTRGSRSALSLLFRGVDEPAYRAQCISGPYGSGKSALALYLARLMDQTANGQVRQRASQSLQGVPGIAIPTSGTGYLTILATGTRENMTACLMRGLVDSLQLSGRDAILKRLRKTHRSTLNAQNPSTKLVVRLFEDLARLAVLDFGLGGVIVIVDELGRLLEHASHHLEDSDIQVLQELAESAARSHEHPLWFVTILHQAFSQYAVRLGRRQQQEWSKVQQRFYDVPCRLDNVDAMQLVAEALGDSASDIIRGNSKIRTYARSCGRLAVRGLEEDFEKLSLASYPLHPTALVALPALFRRFGQNERSLFSYLSADEPYSLHDFLQSETFDPSNPPMVRLPRLYDYACQTLIGGAPPPSVAHAWAEAEDALARLGDALPAQIEAAKSIGLLGLIGESCRLTAAPDALRLALTRPGLQREELDAALQELLVKSIIVFRRVRGCYRLWEGSDVDIDDRLAAANQAIPERSLSFMVARDLCPALPLVARKHAYRTGMLRSFTVIPCESTGLPSAITEPITNDGRIIQCLAETSEQIDEASEALQSIEDPSIITVLARESDELIEAAKDLYALDWVGKNTPELAGDRVARQELNDRRLESESAFRTEWSRLFGPGASEAKWFWCGKELRITCSRELAALLSTACDHTFPLAPVLQNELINRRSLSSAAAAARRNLVEAMITSGHLPCLGIERYPPERSIYESLLAHTGIHSQDAEGQWTFGRPNDTDVGLQAAWDHITAIAQSDELMPQSVSSLFHELSASPYGVADGFVPVLLCANLIANSDTMALYQEGFFVPEFTAPVAELLMKRPEDFSILAYSVSGEREAVIQRFARGFKVTPKVLPVVRSLYQRMGSLTKYVESATNLPEDARAVRDTIAKAKSPERLLFVDLPNAVGCSPFDASDVRRNGNIERFFEGINHALSELLACYPLLLDRVRQGLLDMFGVSPDSDDWRNIVSRRAEALAESANSTRLRTLAIRARDRELGETEYIESVGAGIVGQPPNRWTKSDEETFTRLIPVLTAEIRAAESLQDLRNGLPKGEDGYLLSVQLSDGTSLRRLVRFSDAERESVYQKADELMNAGNGDVDKHILLAVLAEVTRRLLICEVAADESVDSENAPKE